MFFHVSMHHMTSAEVSVTVWPLCPALILGACQRCYSAKINKQLFAKMMQRCHIRAILFEAKAILSNV